LVAILYPDEAIICLSEAIDGGYIDTFLLPDGAKSQDVIDQVGAEALEGTYGTAPTAMETEGSAIFNASYEAEYGEPPPWPFVNTAYDAVVLLALAAEEAGSTNSSAIRDALRDVANPPGEIVGPGEAGIEQALELVRLGQEVNYEGASGPVDLDENGDVTCGAVEVWRIEEGVFVTVRVDIVGTCGP
jgi:branched-chain amino acid transport system substrate-binding protein